MKFRNPKTGVTVPERGADCIAFIFRIKTTSGLNVTVPERGADCIAMLRVAL